MKDAPEAATLRSASLMVVPLTLAGSAAGPTSTKSLYMTGTRLRPKPSATNFSSATWSCTKTTSASPRRAMSSAWPVPTATTRTSMPLAALKLGSRCANRPDCSVEVVEAMTIDFAASCAAARPGSTAATHSTAAATRRRRSGFMLGLGLEFRGSMATLL